MGARRGASHEVVTLSEPVTRWIFPDRNKIALTVAPIRHQEPDFHSLGRIVSKEFKPAFASETGLSQIISESPQGLT
jgi:hypothetical protein